MNPPKQRPHAPMPPIRPWRASNARTPAGANAPGFGSDVIAEALRSLDIPYIALTPGASYRGLHDSIVNYLGNADAADAALPARGGRRRHRARLRQGHRQGDGGRRAFQCRPDARHHGDVQCLVRPHADGDPGRHRPGRRRQAPAVDRLDPHRARSGRAGARIHQMGRPAGLARPPPAKQSCAAPGLPIPRRRARSTSTSTPNCRRPSSPSSCRRSTWRATCRRSRRPRPPSRSSRRRRCSKAPSRSLILAGRASRDPAAWTARVALAEALNARVVTDLKIGASFPTDHPLYLGAPRAIAPESVEGLEERRRRTQPRLGRSRRRHALRRRRRRPRRSSRFRSTTASTTAGAWTIRPCRRSICCSSADPDLVVPELVKAIGKSAKPHAMPSAAHVSDKEPAGFTNETIARALAQGRSRTGR